MSCHNHDGAATVNPCTLCAPLGAVLAAAGVQGALPLLHGAQGCATYIRRYLISHFREPMDVASSSFSEASAVFGGEDNFSRALDNIRKTYDPQAVLVGTTCLAETIGEDLRMMIDRYRANRKTSLPIVFASTPSYKDGHLEGYHAMVYSLVQSLAKSATTVSEGSSDGASSPIGVDRANRINVLPPIVSPADLRHLREIVASFGVSCTMLPDYSDPLDGPIHDSYHPMPEGGTSVSDIVRMCSAAATIDLTMPGVAARASDVLCERGVPAKTLGLPIGVEATDAWIGALEAVTGRNAVDWLGAERGRLLDAYADGHKYVFGKRVAIYGDPELVVALVRFALEIGMRPVLCATGARNRALSQGLEALAATTIERVLEDTDFSTIERMAKELEIELMIGNSKGYRAARSVGVPLLRLGFPIHDRIGAGRILSVGYRGTLALFDALVNTLLERVQDQSTVGFSYL
ncbi:MAG: nitrogenase component 1 [Polyangiaceae bacterium]